MFSNVAQVLEFSGLLEWNWLHNSKFVQGQNQLANSNQSQYRNRHYLVLSSLIVWDQLVLLEMGSDRLLVDLNFGSQLRKGQKIEKASSRSNSKWILIQLQRDTPMKIENDRETECYKQWLETVLTYHVLRHSFTKKCLINGFNFYWLWTVCFSSCLKWLKIENISMLNVIIIEIRRRLNFNNYYI